jgi:aubergine
VHKVLRTQTVLSVIQELKERARGDITDAISKHLVGSTIMTTYNKRTYRIDEVDFSMSPKDTFTVEQNHESKTISYIEYFKTKYDAFIRDINQPCLVSIDKKTGQKIVLIPELCQMTGLTDSMRANFQLMKEMSQITNTDAKRRV